MIRCPGLIYAPLTFSTFFPRFFLLFSKHFEGIMIFSFGRFHSRDVPLVDICLHDMTILFLSIALFSTYHSNIPTRKRVLIPSPLNFVNIDIASVFDILPHACLTAQNLLPVTFQNLLILKSAFTYTSQGLR